MVENILGQVDDPNIEVELAKGESVLNKKLFETNGEKMHV